jgi:hypothetical protein
MGVWCECVCGGVCGVCVCVWGVCMCVGCVYVCVVCVYVCVCAHYVFTFLQPSTADTSFPFPVFVFCCLQVANFFIFCSLSQCVCSAVELPNTTCVLLHNRLILFTCPSHIYHYIKRHAFSTALFSISRPTSWSSGQSL